MRRSRIKTCVIGLGRVGLPHALVSADAGNQVWGIDKNFNIIKNLKKRKAPFFEPKLETLLRRNLNKNFFPTTKLAEGVQNAEVIVSMIGTLVKRHDYRKRVDLRNIKKLALDLACFDLRGKVLIFRTTLPLGGTDQIRTLIEKQTQLACGKDFHIVFCPERSVEGKAVEEEIILPKIIGAYSDIGYRLAKRYFQTIGGKIIKVSSPKTAEFIKLIDNAYRSLIFSFSNDLALLAESNEINVIEAIKAANDNYPRNKLFPPSCGVGGYCLSKDPYYLELAFQSVKKKRGFGSVWYYGRLANDYMPQHLIGKTSELIKKYKIKNTPVRVLVCGISYKKDVDDTRLSHGIEIIRRLLQKQKKYEIRVYDPVIKNLPPSIIGKVKQETDMNKAFKKQDCAIFTINHSQFMKLNGKPIRKLLKKMNSPAIIIDGWNMFTDLKNCTDVVYWGPGNV